MMCAPYKHHKLSRTLTNSECMNLYMRYRNGEPPCDIGRDFDMNGKAVYALVLRIEHQARRRGFKVDVPAVDMRRRLERARPREDSGAWCQSRTCLTELACA